MKDGFIKVAAASPMIKVADADYNAGKVIECMKKAADKGVKVLVFPELTEERRRSTVKEAKNLVEEAKIVMRNARREAIDELKKIQKASTITEDDLRNFTEDIDKNLAKKTEEVDKLFKEKEQEILSI